MENWGIGDFDTRVRLQRCEITTGDTGEKIYNWQCVRDVFAKVERDIDEVIDNGNLEQGQALTLTAPYPADFSEALRCLRSAGSKE